tara:strand:+ start:703 stop:969 length:267 start_codon:yes stop_codon:yes gene_type:complete
MVGHEDGLPRTKFAVLFCSSTNWAFGPLVRRPEPPLDAEPEELLERFLSDHGDPRGLTDGELTALWNGWLFAAEERAAAGLPFDEDDD